MRGVCVHLHLFFICLVEIETGIIMSLYWYLGEMKLCIFTNVNKSFYCSDFDLFVTQGLCSYVLKTNPQAKEMGVCIGYDGRYNSQR